jgi:hypothetical protein
VGSYSKVIAVILSEAKDLFMSASLQILRFAQDDSGWFRMTIAVNTVVGSQISKAATSYFSVHGPWIHPTWEVIRK